MLDQQIAAHEKIFVEEGGYSEQLAAARLAHRAKKKFDRTDQADRADPTDQIPNCPQCGKLMVLRTAKSGKNAGSQFWGCSDYPNCKGVFKL
jgi:ssDNA-binding Zn-finger/Zn-ribbon topoisomerase 1